MLTDLNLASWTKDLGKDYTRTSQQRTETPPCMAHGLLDGSDDRHLYRHDLESLFYIMLIVATLRDPTGGLRTRCGFKELSYKMRFGQPSCGGLAYYKQAFFSNRQRLDLSPAIEDFRRWLGDLRMSSDEKSMPRRSIRTNL